MNIQRVLSCKYAVYLAKSPLIRERGAGGEGGRGRDRERGEREEIGIVNKSLIRTECLLAFMIYNSPHFRLPLSVANAWTASFDPKRNVFRIQESKLIGNTDTWIWKWRLLYCTVHRYNILRGFWEYSSLRLVATTKKVQRILAVHNTRMKITIVMMRDMFRCPSYNVYRNYVKILICFDIRSVI